jgi:hypothetical protein
MKNLSLILIIVGVVFRVTMAVAEEKINMDAMSIIGNKELPNILYILPWKQAELPGMVELPLSSLITDALQPIDRQTMLRRQYYKQVIKQQGVVPASLAEQKK